MIDPSNHIDSIMDVAISGARIAWVAADIPAARGRKVVDAAGLYVTPGLIVGAVPRKPKTAYHGGFRAIVILLKLSRFSS